MFVREPDGSIKLPQFRFLDFNPRRRQRRAAAARVEVIPSILHQDDEPSFWVWMTERDVRKNIKEFGPHPELMKALQSYGAPNKQMSNSDPEKTS